MAGHALYTYFNAQGDKITAMHNEIASGYWTNDTPALKKEALRALFTLASAVQDEKIDLTKAQTLETIRISSISDKTLIEMTTDQLAEYIASEQATIARQHPIRDREPEIDEDTEITFFGTTTSYKTIHDQDPQVQEDVETIRSVFPNLFPSPETP